MIWDGQTIPKYRDAIASKNSVQNTNSVFIKESGENHQNLNFEITCVSALNVVFSNFHNLTDRATSVINFEACDWSVAINPGFQVYLLFLPNKTRSLPDRCDDKYQLNHVCSVLECSKIF